MAETLRDLGVVVDHPEPNVYEVASGDVEWLFVPLEAAAKMRASFMLLGPLLSRFGAGDHQQPRRRPDRAAAGRPPRRGDARARRRRSTTATATTSRRRRAGSAGPRSASRSCRSWAPRTRCSRRRSPRATRSSGPAAQEPEVDDLIAFLQKMGAEVERTCPDTIEVDGASAAPRAPSTHVIPDRIEAGTFVDRRRASPAARSRSTGAAVRPHDGPFLEVLGRAGVVGRLRGRHGSRSTAASLATGGFQACDIETAPYPGLATDLQPPTSVLLTQADGLLERPRGDLRGPPRVARRSSAGWAPAVDIVDNAPRHDPRPTRAPRAPTSRSATCGPARSLILAALAADGHDRRSTARTTSSGGMRTSSASSWISAPGSSASQEGTDSTTS